MQVFLIEDTEEGIAQSLDDTRLGKQAVECFQMLAASLMKNHSIFIEKLLDSGNSEPMAHGNIGAHPATVWAEHSRQSFRFTYNLAIQCIKEHAYRYDKPVSDKLRFQAVQIREHIEHLPFPSEDTQWWPLIKVEDEDSSFKWSPCFDWRLTKKVYQLHYSLKHPTLFTKRKPPAWLTPPSVNV